MTASTTHSRLQPLFFIDFCMHFVYAGQETLPLIMSNYSVLGLTVGLAAEAPYQLAGGTIT